MLTSRFKRKASPTGLTVETVGNPQDVWNYFPRFRLHILVHDLDDWDPKLWRRQLGTSFTGVFGGLHWCGSAT